MPFSSLLDPVALARAHTAYEAALLELSASGRLRAQEERESERLKYIVTSLASVAIDEDDLVVAAVTRFISEASATSGAG